MITVRLPTQQEVQDEADGRRARHAGWLLLEYLENKLKLAEAQKCDAELREKLRALGLDNLQ
jgi:hypothetical protein